MQPSPARVAAATVSLVQAGLPLGGADPERWFRERGLVGSEQVGRFDRWLTGIPGWAGAAMCWAADGDVRAGIGLLLWGGAAERPALLAELKYRLTQEFGPPTDRGPGSWVHWSIAGITIELGPSEVHEPHVELHLSDHAWCEREDDPRLDPRGRAGDWAPDQA